MKPKFIALSLLTLLAACGSGDELGYGNTPADEPSPAQLCVASSCGIKEVLLTIPSAENTLFTPEGRLFVSGDSVYEVTHNGGSWQARSLVSGSGGTGGFTGLAQRGNVLYAVGFGGQLFAAALTAEPVLQPIHALTGMAGPNGMTAGPDGELYIVNGPLSTMPDPKIVRLRLDPTDPMHVIEQEVWLTIPLGFPNGIRRRGRTLYFTDSRLLPTALGLVRAVDIQADGSAGEIRDIGSVLSLPDDFGLAGDGFLVALYATNAIALMGADGVVISQTDIGSFEGASSVRLGQPPLFASTDVLVTEKGLLFVSLPSFGNRLSVFHRR